MGFLVVKRTRFHRSPAREASIGELKDVWNRVRWEVTQPAIVLRRIGWPIWVAAAAVLIICAIVAQRTVFKPASPPLIDGEIASAAP